MDNESKVVISDSIKEQVEEVKSEVAEQLEPTLELSSGEDVIQMLDKKLQNKDEKVNVVISASQEIPNARTVLINETSYHLADPETFDNITLPMIYNHFTESRDLEILTNHEDLKNGRFMASSDTSDNIVLLDLPQESLENIASYAANIPVASEKQEKAEALNNETSSKQLVKNNNYSIHNMGFASGLSIGMAIGTALVLLLVALMYFGIIKLW